VYKFVGRGIFSCGIFGGFKCGVLGASAFERETDFVSFKKKTDFVSFGKETDLEILGGEKSDS
jgi:hypothetical protein